MIGEALLHDVRGIETGDTPPLSEVQSRLVVGEEETALIDKLQMVNDLRFAEMLRGTSGKCAQPSTNIVDLRQGRWAAADLYRCAKPGGVEHGLQVGRAWCAPPHLPLDCLRPPGPMSVAFFQ